jgi:hypothetical protein
MKTTSISTGEGGRAILTQIQTLWPAAKGSVAEVRKPCIRPNCVACKEGKKHRAFILSWNDGKSRRCMYVPSSMVADLRKAIANGRRIERLLSQAGAQMVMEARNRR